MQIVHEISAPRARAKNIVPGLQPAWKGGGTRDLLIVADPDRQAQEAKATLLEMRSVLWEARYRILANAERSELQRCCDLIYSGVPGREEFTAQVRRYCFSIFSCGILVTGAFHGADELFQEIGGMLAMLDEPVSN